MTGKVFISTKTVIHGLRQNDTYQIISSGFTRTTAPLIYHFANSSAAYLLK